MVSRLPLVLFVLFHLGDASSCVGVVACSTCPECLTVNLHDLTKDNFVNGILDQHVAATNIMLTGTPIEGWPKDGNGNENPNIFEKNVNLEHLMINTAGNIGYGSPPLLLTNTKLVALTIKNAKIGSFPSDFFANIPQIQTVTITGDRDFTFGDNCLAALPKLTSFVMGQAYYDTLGLNAFAASSQISHLNLWRDTACASSDFETPPSISHMTNLQYFRYGCFKLLDMPANYFQNLNKLKIIKWSFDSTGATSTHLKNILNIPSLTELEIYSKSSIEFSMTGDEFSNLPALVKFKTDTGNWWGKEGNGAIPFQMFASNPLLEEIHLGLNYPVQYPARLFENNPKLKKVQIQNAYLPSDGVLEPIFAAELPALLDVTISFSPGSPGRNVPSGLFSALNPNRVIIQMANDVGNVFAGGTYTYDIVFQLAGSMSVLPPEIVDGVSFRQFVVPAPIKCNEGDLNCRVVTQTDGAKVGFKTGKPLGCAKESYPCDECVSGASVVDGKCECDGGTIRVVSNLANVQQEMKCQTPDERLIALETELEELHTYISNFVITIDERCLQ